MEEMYPWKVKKAWRPQLLRRLLGTRIHVHVLDDGLHHLDGMILMSKKMTDRSLSDGTSRCHQTFANSIARFERQDFFGLPSARTTGPFLSGRSSFFLFFLLDVTLLTYLGVDEETPSFSFFFLLAVVALTKALYLAASIFAKDNRRALSKADANKDNKKRKNI